MYLAKQGRFRPMHTKNIARYEHSHRFHDTGRQAEKRTLRVVLLTLSMMLVEIVAKGDYISVTGGRIDPVQV